jgi:quinoprotein relay system zinc metallohydrolase 2
MQRHRPVTDISRRRLVGSLTCLGAQAALAPLSLGSAALASKTPLALKTVADGVLAFEGVVELETPRNQGAIANLGVVIGSEAAAVIDSGGSVAQAKAFIAAIKAVTAKPVRYLINTHMHPDHIFGNAPFHELGAQIVGHRNLPRALEARGAYYLQSYREQIGPALMEGTEIMPPTVTVEDAMQLDLGNRRLELKAWQAAHTDNDLTVYDPSSGTLFAGDLVFVNHVPTLDGSLLGWMRQMDALAAIPAVRVVPGHGPVPSPWPQALAAERRYFETLAADLRKAIAAGVPMADAVAKAGAREAKGWALFEDYNGRNAIAAYAELEWE